MTWAWTVRLPPAPKLVLMALADEADDRGFCFPSQRHLAEKCNITERSVRRMVRLLARLQHIAIEQRFKKDRARTSNGYRLAIEHPRTICPGVSDGGDRGQGTALSGDRGQRCQGAPDSPVRVTTTEPGVEPKPLPLLLTSEPKEAPRECGAGELCFPKGITPNQRHAIQRHVHELSFEEAQQVLDELAGRMTATQVANPIRYCAALVGRLKRGEFTLELGVSIAERRSAERQYQARLQQEPRGCRSTTELPIGRLSDELRASLERMRPKAPENAIERRLDGYPPSTPATDDAND